MGIGAASQKKLDDVGVAVAGGHHQSRETVAGDFVRIGAAVEERLDRFDLRFVDCVEQGSPVVAAGGLIGIRTLMDQIADRSDVAGAGGVSERRELTVRPGASEEKNREDGKSHAGSYLSSTL